MPDPVIKGGEPVRGRDAADIDPQFAHIRPRKSRKVTDLKASGESSEGDRVVRVPGHVYGIGEVVDVRAGNRAGTRWIRIEYPREPGVYSIELEEGRSLELHDPDGPVN